MSTRTPPLPRRLPVALALLLALAPAAHAQDDSADLPRAEARTDVPPPAGGYDTCLVLSGGGARGMAHIGVIKVLERERIPVDCIVGTSMGAVVGGLYASGLGAAEIEARLRALDWKTMFSDRVDRRDFPARRKAEDRSFLAKGGFGLRDGKLGVAPSLFEGQRLAVALRTAMLPSANIDDFDALPIPYRAIGTDLETGETVAMDHGDLVNAIRASMAVPGAFSPVSYGERSLIDGGVSMNLPVEVAQALGARHVIAVDIGATLKKRDQLLDPFSITDQMVTALMLRETQRQRDRLRADDVLIVPTLGDLSSTDMTAGLDQGIPLGEAAAEAALPKLRARQLSPEAYAAWREARLARLRPIGPIEKVELVNTSAVDDTVIRAAMTAKPGDTIVPEKIERDLSHLYGSGEFSRAYYTVTDGTATVDGQVGSVLTYVTRSRRWEEDGTLKFGLFLQDDFEGHADYQLGARFGKRELNRFGGDLLLEARLGDRNRAFAEWNQPLDPRRHTFFRSSLEWLGRNETLLDDDALVGSYRIEHWQFRAGLGLDLGDWGEASVTPFTRRNHFRVRSGPLPIGLPSGSTSAGAEFALVLDTQDDAEFPAHGWHLHARHARYLQAFGSDTRGFTTRLETSYAFSALGGRWLASANAQDRRGDAYEDIAHLGGLFRLSGYGIDTLHGTGAAVATLQYRRPLAQVLEYPLFLGGSLEAGQVWQRGESPSAERTLFGGSLYSALDTPLGPIYFGFGIAEHGEEAVFLRLGQPD